VPSHDTDRLARELVRYLRGRRSQLALSRHLGFASNVCQSWELGKRYPSASAFLALARKMKLPVKERIGEFLQHRDHWSAVHDPADPCAVTALLADLRGDRRIRELSASAGTNRATLSRWLKGSGEPRLPELLRVVHAATHRLLEFVAIFAPPEQLSVTKADWEDLERQRRVAYDLPMSHAVLRALELRQYAELKKHVAGFVAALLGISLADERRYLSALSEAKLITKRAGLWRVTHGVTVDTRRNVQANLKLKRYWAQLGAERAAWDTQGLFCYNVFSVSEADYRRLCEMHLAYFEELRAIVSRSQPEERVVVANLQMFAIDSGPPPA
jgi:DNA-binding phage protein